METLSRDEIRSSNELDTGKYYAWLVLLYRDVIKGVIKKDYR